MDIIVTTPKREMAAAAQEAADARAAGGQTEYFRRFPHWKAPRVAPGDRVYYVEDGFIRGYTVVSRVLASRTGELCETTRRWWEPGFYVFMRADSWRWIRPIPMTGFQGFRYAGRMGPFRRSEGHVMILVPGGPTPVVEVGGWLDPRPPVDKDECPATSIRRSP